MDPLMGIVGSIVIGRWAIRLLRDSGGMLLDAADHGESGVQIRALVERDAETRIADLHIWRIGPRSRACILSLVTHAPRQAAFYKEMLEQVPHLDHVTVEINHCTPDLCPATDNRT